MSHPPQTTRWGVLGQFPDASSTQLAVEALRSDGLEDLEVFTPFPLDCISDSLGLTKSPMPWVILVGGILGGGGIYTLEYWVSVHAYPLNVGGRPLLSWPSFVPPAFEGTVLGAAIFALIGLLWICRLPRLHHPIFEIEQFRCASEDGFFVAVPTDQIQAQQIDVASRLAELGAIESWEVPHG